MRRAQDGDRRAYETLLLEVSGLVRSYVKRRLRASDQTEDIVQDTLLSIHHHRHTYDPARPFGPWMYAIARHRLLDQIARNKRRNETELVAEAIAAPQPRVENSPGFVDRALAQLSNTQREIIHLLKVEGYTVPEISRKTGMSESSVKITAHRGYNKLRKLIVRSADEE
jgi:RNA polymerase sigma-70 factor (ECF subfamily)